MCASSAQQKKSFVFRQAKYLASFSVDGVDNEDRPSFIEKNLENLRNLNLSKDVVVCISVNGIKIHSSDMDIIYMAHALRRISYSTCDPNYPQFAFVAREPKMECTKQYCHVFGTDSNNSAQELNQIVGRAFELASYRQNLIKTGFDSGEIEKRIPNLSDEFESFSLINKDPVFEIPPPPPLYEQNEIIPSIESDMSKSVQNLDVQLDFKSSSIKRPTTLNENIKKDNHLEKQSSLLHRFHKQPTFKYNNNNFIKCFFSGEGSPVVALKDQLESEALFLYESRNSDASKRKNKLYNGLLPDYNNISSIKNRNSMFIKENDAGSSTPPMPPIRLNSLRKETTCRTSDNDLFFRSSRSIDNFISSEKSPNFNSGKSSTPVPGNPETHNLEFLSSVTWYKSEMSREDALRNLETEEVGNFILRESSTQPGCIALSLRVPKSFSTEKIAHYLIQKCAMSIDNSGSINKNNSDNNSTLQYVIKIKGLDKYWSSLKDLVFHLTRNPEILPCKLNQPICIYRINPIYTMTNQLHASCNDEEDEDYQKLSDFSSLNVTKVE